MSKTIGVIAIKGGVGKTTTVSNLGAILSTEFKKKVLVVDANFSAANLGLHLGIVKPEHTIHDVLADNVEIKDAVVNYKGYFDILPASIVPKKVDPMKLKEKLSSIKDDYDMILIDSSPSLNKELLAAMQAADELLVITSPDYPTLSSTMHAVKIAKKKNARISGLVLNRVRGKKYELSLQDVEDSAETPVLAVLPDDSRVAEALSFTIPAAIHKPDSNAVVEYKHLAAALVGEEYKDERISAKLKKMFRRNVPKHEVNRALFREEKR